MTAIRRKLNAAQGRHYWRSLEELADTNEFREMLQREFPEGVTEWWDDLSRRNFLKMAGASLALAGLTACTKQPPKEILPYVNQPEGLVPGEPLFYATAMVQGGFATGILVKSREGHPIKIEGNPFHPSSLGASSIWMQASILDLYDPDRSRTVNRQGDLSTWELFLSDLNNMVRDEIRRNGAGLRFLTETITSPTLGWQLSQLLKRFPEAKWHQYEPLNRDNVHDGARLAFGEIVECHYRFDKATIVLALDSDFLYAHPQALRNTRHFTDGRRISAGKGEMNRLYMVESSPTITGTMADHRLPLESGKIQALVFWLAAELGVIGDHYRPKLNPRFSQLGDWLPALAQDLQRNHGTSAIVAGERQPAIVHALAHAINEQLGNVGQTIFYTESAQANPGDQTESLRELVDDMKLRKVETLFIIGGNPVYNAPADFKFGDQLRRVRRAIHLGMELNETAAFSTWHIPQAHYLESWSDARAFDGTASILQPLIAPLYKGKTAHEVLGAITQQQPLPTDYSILRQYWRTLNRWPDFEEGWRRALHDGFIAGSALASKPVRVNLHRIVSAANAIQITIDHEPSVHDLEINFAPDPSILDGRFANNGWLQECPRPISKLTWDNAALVSPAAAARLQLQTGDLVMLEFAGNTVKAPVMVMPGQAENSATIHLGYGRSRVGRVANGIGFNAYRLRQITSPWFGSGLHVVKLGKHHPLVATQTHHNVEGEERQIYRDATFDEFRAGLLSKKLPLEVPDQKDTLYDPNEFLRRGHQWGMSIDLSTCIGCNACLVACEAENNIPVVGKDQVARHREMFWIRVDTYFKGDLQNPEFHHMPVPCMHCEHAPCELVCPVAATVHDHEGLNLQVYNRCIGTRFCSNNCPYKVRRFNFYQYTNYQQPSLQPMYNPEVTVRWRGVMEKCTYCVQRISHARITAEKENRGIRDGEIQTACQQACPAEAIVFGDLADPTTRVAQLKKHPLDYPMLGQLNTRPRTTYLAKVVNPNSRLIGPL